MTTSLSTADYAGHIADVVGVELTIDGVLAVADLLGLSDFPTALAIRPNIPFEELRDRVWDSVCRDLAVQGVLTPDGRPHPAVAEMLKTLSTPERILEARWWRIDAGGVMTRFAIARKGEQHVLAVRDGDVIALQLIAPQVGLAGMVTAVLGAAPSAAVEPLTAPASELAGCTTAEQLTQLGAGYNSARAYSEITRSPNGWVEIVATEYGRDRVASQTPVAAGVLDSAQGRLVSTPRLIGGQVYGSFLPGSQENLQLALDGLLGFLPSGGWFSDD